MNMLEAAMADMENGEYIAAELKCDTLAETQAQDMHVWIAMLLAITHERKKSLLPISRLDKAANAWQKAKDLGYDTDNDIWTEYFEALNDALRKQQALVKKKYDEKLAACNRQSAKKILQKPLWGLIILGTTIGITPDNREKIKNDGYRKYLASYLANPLHFPPAANNQ